jgi:hypothetical protein
MTTTTEAIAAGSARMSERERLICEVGDYFGKFAPPFAYNIHEGNVDEYAAIMRKEKLQRLADAAVDKDVPLTPEQEELLAIDAGQPWPLAPKTVDNEIHF